MSFDVGPDAYDKFMGRYSRLLAGQMADLAGVRDGQRVLDVGCGPGALTAELVERGGAPSVSAVDPSLPFVAAIRTRFPEVDARQAPAEALPFDDGSFDAVIAQLVVHFMIDPVAGLREMARVVCPGGVVAACVWDHAGGQGPLSLFWEAARELDPAVTDESNLAGAPRGPSCGPVSGSRAASSGRDGCGGRLRASELRELVGAAYLRRRAGRRLRCGA